MFRVLGGVAWALALLIGYGASVMPTAAPGAETVAFVLLSSQTDAFIVAVGFAISGSIFLAAAAIIGAVEQREKKQLNRSDS